MLDPNERIDLDDRALLELVYRRDELFRHEPRTLIPWIFAPCKVKTLLVTDGGLDFGSSGFGLRAFVETLLAGAGFYVQFEITLAHIGNRSGDALMDPDARIARRINNFRFDDGNHFTPDMYDQVWLFGIESSYANVRIPGNPTATLLPPEIAALDAFMDQGGGLFATGDHGSLGKALCSQVTRAKSMRLWDSTTASNATNEVSMTGERRNDTNRAGHDAGTQFDDQSDDVPQTIQPRLYRRNGVFIWRWAVFPHPLLCGPAGVITVMPDHPHEGECVEPVNPSLAEFPDSIDGSPRPLPAVISTSTVPAGNVADFKDPTRAHSFGGIGAYDGHLAGKGRVVVDATWHHFVNINLIGDSFASGPKTLGFLATPEGRAHLAQIRAYYRNIAVWISPPGRIRCMNNHILWRLVWVDRVIEAVATRANLTFAETNTKFLYDLGVHARDVLGRLAGRCQSYEFLIELVRPVVARSLIRNIDPWFPRPSPDPEPVPWFDIEPLLAVALGGALLALRERYPEPESERMDIDDDVVAELVTTGAARGAEMALDDLLSYGDIAQLLSPLDPAQGAETSE